MAETPNATHGWAVVTGASGGMGAVFTRALAKRGYPVLAVARATTPLAKLAEEMSKEGARVEVLACDLATAEGVTTVVERARALGDIELLVNNAGLSTSGRFLDQARDREIQSIRVNVEALYTLTRDLVPEMVKRKRGGVINIASVTAFQAIPFWTTYAATKAFVLSLGEGLADQRLTRPRRRLSPSASKWHLRCVNRVVEAIMNGNSDSDALAAAERLTPVILTSREGNDGATIVQRMELKIDAAALVGRPLEVRSKGQGERRRPAERSRAVRFRHSCSIARRPVASWWSCPTSSGAEAQSDICIYNLSGG